MTKSFLPGIPIRKKAYMESLVMETILDHGFIGFHQVLNNLKLKTFQNDSVLKTRVNNFVQNFKMSMQNSYESAVFV